MSRVHSETQVITPFFRSPFTDLTQGLTAHAQHYDKCGELEMNMMECLEAYGIQRGKRKCSDLIDDFQECYTMRKQQLRSYVRYTLFTIETFLNLYILRP